MYPQSLPLEMVGSEFEDNAIVQLNNDGEILFEKSVSQIFIDNGLEHLLFSVGDDIFDVDPIHLNDIHLLILMESTGKKEMFFYP